VCKSKGPLLDRRLTTIVAADLVGYSRLMAADEEGTISRLQGLLKNVIRPEIANHDGRVVKTMGDGLLVEFPSTVAALKSSMVIQTRVAQSEADTGEDQRMRFRVGINLGDVVIDGNDILGDGVNIAARLESLAPPGGICVSRAVYEQVKGKVSAGYTDLGPQQVKNIPDPVEVWGVEVDGVESAPAKPRKPAKRPSIVVLPFDNMSSDPEQDFLADGIVEDVTTELSRFRTLFVIARNSAFAYKGARKDVRAIATELDVNYVVEGSVRRAGNRLRITAQLIEAHSGNHIWAERWDRTMEDLFDVQDELTSAIVSGVEPELGAHERAMVRRKPTESLTAWELCQRGYSEYEKYSDEDNAVAFDLYHRAIAADPDFALPYAYLALWHWAKVGLGRSTDMPGDIRAGIGHAANAIACDDRLEVGYAAQGILLATVGQENDATEALNRAEQLNANYAFLHFLRATACLYQQDPDTYRMEASARKAIELSPKDPLVWGFLFNLANAHFMRDFDVTNPQTREGFEAACRYPNADYIAFMNAAIFNAAYGRNDEARHYLEQAMERYPSLSLEHWRTAFPFPVMANILEAEKTALETLVELGLPRE
jgi:adenylate cyclase